MPLHNHVVKEAWTQDRYVSTDKDKHMCNPRFFHMRPSQFSEYFQLLLHTHFLHVEAKWCLTN